MRRSTGGGDEEADSVRRREVLGGLSAVAVGGALPGLSLEVLRHDLDRAGAVDHDDWERIAADYARDFYTTPTAALLEGLTVDLTILQRAMAASRSADLNRIAGQLSVIVAMALASTGQSALARRWWRTARRQADASGDLATRVWMRDWEVVNGTYERRPLAQILTLADETTALMGDHVSCGTAGVHSGRAQALALAGRTTEAEDALHAVADATERMPDAILADADSMFGWPEVRLHHTASYVYSHVGDVDAAFAAQDRALALYPQDLERERAQLQMHRALCLVGGGHITDGLRYAADVLDRLPPERHNALLYEVVRHVIAAVPQRERRRPEVAELSDRITAIPST